MDDLDRRLVGLLRENSRSPVATLAQQLGVARGTVQSRIDRLLERGDILNFTVRLKNDEVAGVRAVTLISEHAKDTRTVIRALRQIPEARAIFTANGRWDLMVEMVAENLTMLDEALARVRRIDRVTETETLILLTPHKE